MTTTLITGIGGFTGHHLAAELTRAGHDVVGLSSAPVEGQKGIRTEQCDMLDRLRLGQLLADIRPDAVVHLAAVAFISEEDIEATYRTNIVGTRNLLAAIAETGHTPRAILLASSANIYGNASTQPITENTVPAPANDYAVSKLAMEQMARLWFDRLPLTLVRPFNYTGVGQSTNFLLPKIVDHFRRKVPVLELGNLDVVRDFSDVRSVTQIYRRLLEQPAPGQVFNICSGVGNSLRDVLGMVSDIAGWSPEIRVNPAFVRANEVHRLVGSKAALEAYLGPLAGPSLRETLAWMTESH